MRQQESKRMRQAKVREAATPAPLTESKAPTLPATISVQPGDALAGLYFHAFHETGVVKARGQVDSFLGQGHYLVLLLDANEQALYHTIATLDEMRIENWRFYKDRKTWMGT